jgi:hypothetical protein
MDTGIVDVAAYSRRQMQLDIHELMNPKPGSPHRGELQPEVSPPVPPARWVWGDWERVYGPSRSGTK